jgi:two-component system copper resistance phosphate regulon response regulator CusR
VSTSNQSSTHNTPQVLVVEDDPKTRQSLIDGLSGEAWSVANASDGDEAVSLIDRLTFDLVVLDWTLPGRDGFSVLRHLRSRGAQVPVLMLTGRCGLDDRVSGLEGGADDYVAKPFAFAEVMARCRALLRRTVLATGHILNYKDLQLDTRARIAHRGGVEIPLTPREVDVLEYLMRYQGQVVTREMLEREVWRQVHRFSSLDNVIDVQMMRLRRKIDRDGDDKVIHTLRGLGYRLGGETA